MSQTTIRVEQIRSTSVSLYRNINLQQTGSVIKNTPGKLVGFDVYTTISAERYVKFYDKATAPTAADTVKMTVAISNTNPSRVNLPGDLVFNSGISIRATTGIADNDAGNPAANTIFANVFYE